MEEDNIKNPDKTAEDSNIDPQTIAMETELSDQKTTTSNLQIGDIVDAKYKIMALLGKGGMGTVYKIEHLLLKKIFALKVLHPQLSHNELFRKRFLREAQIAMDFSHEHVLQIREFGETGEKLQYFTIDFSNGRSLKEILAHNKVIAEKKALTITRQILNALKSGHARNIIHRDLKPANIILESRFGKDHALVLDFGIAKILEQVDETKLTQEGVIGTPHYMSPEQAGGESLDIRSDIYSMGIILYQMVTGVLPFEGKTTVEVIVARILKTPLAPRKINPKISSAIEKIIQKAMAKDSNLRFASTEEFITAIDYIQNGQEVNKVHFDKITKMPEKVGQKRWQRTSYAIAIIFLIAIFVTLPILRKERIKPTPNAKKNKEQSQKTDKLEKEQMDKSQKKRLAKIVKEDWTVRFMAEGGISQREIKQLVYHLEHGQKILDMTSLSWANFSYKQQIKLATIYQRIYANWLDKTPQKKFSIAKTTFTMVLVPPGCFWMGSPDDEKGRSRSELRHRVVITRPFWLGKYEVTQGQWRTVTGKSPWSNKNYAKNNPKHPVSHVSWEMIKQQFLPKLGTRFTLPSEAQWEYACRAGTLTTFYWGVDENYKEIDKYAWYEDSKSDQKYIRKVGQKRENAWGLHDISGNLWEWCYDWYASYSGNKEIDPTGPIKGVDKIARGGSWSSNAVSCRSAVGIINFPRIRNEIIGFRLCMRFGE